MSYTFFDVNSANPAADLYGVTVGNSGAVGIAGLLTAAGFTLVDTVTISTRTHKVWKSPAGSNAAGLDWYLDVAYTTTGAGSIWFFPFENYNASTHVATRGAIQDSSTTVDATTFSRNGSTTAALESATGGMHPASATSNMNLVTQTSTLFRANVSVTADRVIAYSRASTGRVHYCGLYTPSSAYSTAAGAGLFPLCVAQIGFPFANSASGATACSASASSTTATFSLTRIAPLTALAAGWQTQGQVFPTLTHAYGAVGAPTWTPELWPLMIIGGSTAASATGGTASLGKIGELKDIGFVATDASQNDGDTLSSGAYVLTARQGSYGSIAFKAS